MNRRLPALVLFTALLLLAAAALPAAARNAPDFTLLTPDGKQVRLSDLRGKFVVVEFLSPT